MYLKLHDEDMPLSFTLYKRHIIQQYFVYRWQQETKSHEQLL